MAYRPSSSIIRRRLLLENTRRKIQPRVKRTILLPRQGAGRAGRNIAPPSRPAGRTCQMGHAAAHAQRAGTGMWDVIWPRAADGGPRMAAAWAVCRVSTPCARACGRAAGSRQVSPLGGRTWRPRGSPGSRREACAPARGATRQRGEGRRRPPPSAPCRGPRALLRFASHCQHLMKVTTKAAALSPCVRSSSVVNMAVSVLSSCNTSGACGFGLAWLGLLGTDHARMHALFLDGTCCDDRC